MGGAAVRRYAEVDVFASGRPWSGNPLAVVVDADGLGDSDMQAFASWTNLSETTFLLPPTSDAADYRVRIFTPAGELPFAGHPTLGTARVWLEHGGVPRRPDLAVQECAYGLIAVRVDADTLAFDAPPRTRTGPLDADTLRRTVACLGIATDDVVAHEWGDNGPGWAMVQLRSADAVRAARPDVSALGELKLGLVGLERPGGPFAYEVRAMLPPPMPREDPVTGSLQAAVAQWFRGRGLVPERYRAAQGSQVGRAGEVSVVDDGDRLWIGGRAVVRVMGHVYA